MLMSSTVINVAFGMAGCVKVYPLSVCQTSAIVSLAEKWNEHITCYHVNSELLVNL